MKRAFFVIVAFATTFTAHGIGSTIPLVEFEMSGDKMNVWVATDGEVVDVAVLAGPHRRAEAVPSELITADGLSLAAAQTGARTTPFVAHAIILYAPAEDPGSVTEYSARAFFLCDNASCKATSYSNYMVATGVARRILNTEGESAIDFDLEPVEVSK